MTLAGELMVWAADSYVPVVGNAFPVISFTSRTGQFQSVSVPPTSEWQTTYNSANVTVTVTGASVLPEIARQPESQAVTIGNHAQFSVLVTNTSAAAYQWRKDNEPLPGATQPSLTLWDVQAAQAGTYSVVVTNAAGSVTSHGAVMTVAEPTCAPQPSGLVAWWRGEEDALDAVAGENGTMRNGAGFRVGRVGHSFNLDGVDDYVSLGSLSALRGATEMTVGAWINLNDFRNDRGGIVGKWNTFPPSNDNTFLLSTEWGGMFALNFADSTGDVVIGASPLPVNQWIHVVGTWRSSDGLTTIYKNGAIDGQRVLGQGKVLRYHENYPAVIGEWGVARDKFHGQIDEVVIFDRALSLSEIHALYNAGAAGMCLVSAPEIVVHPQGTNVVVGADVSLTVTATGTEPLRYQWMKGTEELPAQTNRALVLAKVQLSDAGDYSVRVSNDAGTAWGGPATLVVQPAPTPYYTFDALNAGEAELPGQDGWEFGRSLGSARVRAVTGGTGNRVHVGPGGFAFTLRPASRFDLPALTGEERRVTVQLDLNFAGESGQLPPPHMGPPEGSGLLWGKRNGFEVQPNEAAGFLMRSSTLMNLGLGSREDWYRVRLVADLAEPVGTGSVTTYVQNLSRGDTVWTSLGRVSLKLNEMSPQSRPPSWDTLALVLMDGVEADNLLVQTDGEALPALPEFNGNIPQPVQTRIGTPLAQVIGVAGADGVSASGLPGWLTFDPGTRTLQGTAPEGSSGHVNVVLTAFNAQGRAVLPVTVQVLYPEAQTITFEPVPDKFTDDAPFAVTASASSGLPVTLTVVSGPATVSGNTVTLTGVAGTVTLRAAQAGGGGWAAAAPVERSFEVRPAVAVPIALAGASGPEGFTITLTGAAGGNWTVQGSDDLKTWTDLQEIMAFDGEETVVDPMPAGLIMRYYRAVRR